MVKKDMFAIGISTILLIGPCIGPREKLKYDTLKNSEQKSLQKEKNLEEKTEVTLRIVKSNKQYGIECVPSYNLSKEEKIMISYLLARNRFDGFLAWMEKLKSGNKKEREKFEKYMKANPRLYFNEEIFLRTVKDVLLEQETLKGWSWEVLLAVMLMESMVNQIYGRDQEGGPFHALPSTAKAYAKKLRINVKGDIKEFLRDNPDVALQIYLAHMNDLLKHSKTPEEALAKYNAGKYWQKHLGYAENIEKILEHICYTEEKLMKDSLELWEKFWKTCIEKGDEVIYNALAKERPVFYLYAYDETKDNKKQNKTVFKKIYEKIYQFFNKKRERSQSKNF
ncbi:MAG: hypothetical protein QXQ82_00605 [Candidatus Pacearchaeota archaeon]